VPASVARFWQRVAHARTLAYTVKAWVPDVFGMHGSTPTKSVFFVYSTFEIKARRPDHVSIVRSPAANEYETTEAGRTHTSFDAYGDDVYVSDGRRSLFLDTTLRIYQIGVAPKTLNATGKKIGKDDPISWFRPAFDWFFDDHPMEGYKPSADPRFSAAAVAVFQMDNPAQPGLQDKIYFDRKTGELRRISHFEKDDKGGWKETGRSEFRFWDFDPPIPATVFDTRVPRGYRPQEELDRELEERQAGRLAPVVPMP